MFDLTDKIHELSRALEHVLKVADMLESVIETHPNATATEFLFHPNSGVYHRLFGGAGAGPLAPSSTASRGRSFYVDPVNELKAGASLGSKCLQDLTVAWLDNQSKLSKMQAQCSEAKSEVEKLNKRIDDRERLGAIRSSDMFRELLYAESSSSAGRGKSHSQCADASCSECSKSSNSPAGGPGTSSSGSCVHKQVLADHVIDKTFDDHKQILRSRLKEVEEELEKFRSGDMFTTLRQKLNDSFRDRDRLQKEVDSLKREIMASKISKLENRVSDSGAEANSNPSSSSLQKTSGQDPVRLLREEINHLKAQRSLEMSMYVQFTFQYLSAMTSAMCVGYDLKLEQVKEGLSSLLLPVVMMQARNSSTSPKSAADGLKYRPTPPGTPIGSEDGGDKLDVRHMVKDIRRPLNSHRRTHEQSQTAPISREEICEGLGQASATSATSTRMVVQTEPPQTQYQRAGSGGAVLSERRVSNHKSLVPDSNPPKSGNGKDRSRPTDPSQIVKASLNTRPRPNRLM